MKHLLMDPAFPDIVGEFAVNEFARTSSEFCVCANDNRAEPADELSDPLLTALARLEIAATRLW
jgi:hypothetical protein